MMPIIFHATYDPDSGTSFTVSSGGLLQYSSTHLAHDGNNVRFYSSAGTPLYVYKLDSPDPQDPATDGALSLSPAAIYMSGKCDNGDDNDGYFYSAVFECDSKLKTSSGKDHTVYIEPSEDHWADYMSLSLYDDYGYSLSNPYYFASEGSNSNPYFERFKLRCYAPEPGTFEATLVYTAYQGSPYPEIRVPIVIILYPV